MAGFLILLIVTVVLAALITMLVRVRSTVEIPSQQAISQQLEPLPTEFDNLSQDEEALILMVLIETGMCATHYAAKHVYADQRQMISNYLDSEKCKRDRRALIALFGPDLSESDRNAIEIKIILMGSPSISEIEMREVIPRIWKKHKSSLWYRQPFVDC